MKRKNMTRNALFTSIISLLLCVSMLVGTTFAWFTDSVTSDVNTIASGNLDVELYHSNKEDQNEKVNSTTVLFDDVTLWEPGAVAYENFVIANEGTLALKYQMTLNALNATETPSGKTLADVLQVAIVDGGFNGGREAAHALQNYTSLSSFTLPGELKGDTKSATYGVVVYWRPDTDHTDGNYDNEFNVQGGLKIDLGISLFATQEMHEDDSFGTDYDQSIWDDALKVMSEAELIAALENGETMIMLEENIALTKALEIPADAKIALNLNGKTITAGADGYAITNEKGAAVSLGNGEIKGIVYNANGSTMVIESGVYTAIDTYAILNDAATMTINSATINGTDKSYPIYSYNDGQNLLINNVTINGVFGALNAYGTGSVVINGGTFNMTGVAGTTSHIAYFSTTTNVVINGGSFNHVGDISMSATGGGGICLNGQANVTINGGNFAGDYADVYSWSNNAVLSIKGGTFANKPDNKHIAAGYKVVENNGKYVVVADSVDNVIATAADLYALRSTGWEGKTVSGTYELVADIDMSGYDMTPIAAEGELNFYGNGHTISNLNLVEAEINVATSGLFTARYDGTATNISNLTLENVTSTSSKYSAAVFAYSGNGMAINMNNVDVKNATIKGDSAAALVAYATVPVNLTGCDVSGLVLDGAFDEDKVGAFISTANTATCVVTVGNCTNSTSYRDYGRVLSGASINGVIYNKVSAGLYKDDAGNYYVYNAAGLATLNDVFSSGAFGHDIWGKTFNIIADIDANGVTWNSVKLNTPNNDCNGFTWNGNGHTISNLTISGSGLFTSTANGKNSDVPATFKNLTFKNVAVNSGYHVGILWGQMYGDLFVENVHVTDSTITGTCNVGALVGRNGDEGASTITFKKCSVTNTKVTATGAGDPNGASAFLGSALTIDGGANVVVAFENCAQSGNTLSSAEGQVGGGIYAKWNASTNVTDVVNDF